MSDVRDIICGHCGADMQLDGRELMTPCDCWSGGINPPEWLRESDPLAALRAEVERLRALIAETYRDSGADAAYATVLDLIDKHTREGQ